MTEDFQSTNPFACVDVAVRALLTSLHDFVPMRLWMVGRIATGRWTMLGAEDRRGRIAA